MRGLTGWVSSAMALAVAFGCGGSTESGTGTGGTTGGKGGSATGGSATGATAGQGGTGNIGPVGGGSGGIPGGTGGTCVATECGPAGMPCCSPSEACSVGTPSGSMTCTCSDSLFWECSGVGGGGTGGTGGCVDTGCGPHGAPCCAPGIGCASASGGSPGVSCYCTAIGIWDCQGGFGGTGAIGGTGGGGGTCFGPNDCALGTTCCAGKCVNLANDPFNCGACGNTCASYPPYCSGTCTKPPCNAPTPPPPGSFCCGQSYCGQGQLCCDVQGPGPSFGPTCFTPTPTQPTCPIGCPLCQ